MKTLIKATVILFLLIAFPEAKAVHHDLIDGNEKTEVKSERKDSKAKKITRKEFERQLGRKMSFKERIGFALLKGKLNKAQNQNQNTDNSRVPTDGLAIASLVLGIIGIFVAGLILGFLAILFAILSFKNIKKHEGARKGKGLATAGLIIGIAAVLGAAYVIIFLL